MRLAIFVVFATACSFQAGTPSVVDAPSQALTIDGSVDAPCPDADHDGVCDADDDWPCGPMPAALPTSITIGGGMTTAIITQVSLQSAGQLVVVSPGSPLSLVLHYAITDTACSIGCIDQLEVGFVPAGERIGCVFDQMVSPTSGASGTATGIISPANTSLTAPTTPGTYDFRMEFGQNFACDFAGATDWYSGAAPGPSGTLATVCVH